MGTKVLDFDSAYDDLKKEVDENMSDTQKNYMKKMENILDYRRQMYLNHLNIVFERSHIDLTSNMMNFCRATCLNMRSDDISSIEKKCVRNCIGKYNSQFKILDSFKENYANKLGTEMFITGTS